MIVSSCFESGSVSVSSPASRGVGAGSGPRPRHPPLAGQDLLDKQGQPDPSRMEPLFHRD